MRKPFLAICALLAPSLASADTTTDFHQLLEKHWQNAEQEQVFFRTDPDGWKPHGKLADFSPEGFARREAFNNQILDALANIPLDELTGEDKVSYRLFAYERQTEKAYYASWDRYFPMNFLSGWHTYFADAPANMAFLNLDDYQQYLVSLADFPRFNDENIALMQAGADKGLTQYCESFKGYESTISAYLGKDPKQSPWYAPFTHMPGQISSAKQQELRQQGLAMIEDKILPAYQHLYDFFTQEYMPKCRQQAGIGSLAGGADYYAYTAEFYTTTNMSPQAIHTLGKSEVARIYAEMQEVIKQSGFSGDFKAYLAHIAADPSSYAESRQDVIEKTAFIAQKMYGQLPKFFGNLPRNTFAINGDSRRLAYYMPPSDSASPGTYFINSDVKMQPLYNLTSLTLHEAIPGHHLQTALAMELDMPEFRKTLNHSAFGEGWALYSERLGKEAGFYQTPAEDFGRLGFEMWRACRLVVDTGIHAMGWSRQQAIDYLKQYTALTDQAIADQIDRYITWPGQALSYKIGELKIRQFRQHAEQVLGEKFDLRAFHDQVIGHGSLPIDVLEDILNDWISAQQ